MNTPERSRPAMPLWLALAGAVLVGILTVSQSRINGELGHRLSDGFVSAVISFGSGFVILLVLSLCLPAGRQGIRSLVHGVRRGRVPWWMLAGGAAGAFTVVTQGVTVALIGASLFTVGLVAGQTVNGLVLDRVGYGPAGAVAVTLPRVAGGALALAAVAVSLQGGVLERVPWWMLLLPFLAGIGIAWQQATNGLLRREVGTPLTATLVNFAGGTLLLIIAAVIEVAIAGPPDALPPEPILYTGGAIGVVYIFLSAALVAHTGVLLLGLGTVAGQVTMAFVIDVLWPVETGANLLLEGITVVIALAAVFVAVPWRRRAAR